MAHPNLVSRLRGEYAMGPHLPNGKPEFGWRQFESPPICHEAAERIQALEAERDRLKAEVERLRTLVWISWNEMNAIRARSGVPLDEGGGRQGISEAYWSDAVDAMSEALGDDCKPWPAEYMKQHISALTQEATDG